MSTPNPYDSVVRFSAFELDFPSRVLRKSGIRLHCQEQPLQVLAALLEKPGTLITREELRQRVWPQDTFVDFDHALNTAVKKLRNVLSDDADAPRYIETVPRRGYRFVGPIQPVPVPLAVSQPLTAPPVISTDSSPPLSRHTILIGFLGLVFVCTVVYYLSFRRAGASRILPAARPVMLAVLPFQNMTGDPAQDSFSDGMTEETTTRLARLNSSRFHVIARTSAMKYKGVPKSVDEIARELHADYLLEGSIRREGPQVRISCQLIRAADQSPQWTQAYNFDSGDPLDVETRVAATIAGQLNAMLGDPSTRHHPFDYDAFDSYLRGLAESSIHTTEGLDRIIATLDKALVEDPNCAQPFASLARVYERGANLGFLQPRAAYAKARDSAERAIQLDPLLPEPHAYMADALLTIDYDWKGAQAEIRKALDLNANDPIAHEWNGVFLALQDQSGAALQELERASDLDPLNADRKVFLGAVLQKLGRNSDAEQQLKAALQLDPASTIAHSSLIHLYTVSGRQAEAISESSAFFVLEGQPEIADGLRSVYRRSGFDAATRFGLKEQLAYLMRLRSTRYVSAFSIAVIYAQFGDKAQAVSWLEKSYQARDVELPCLPYLCDSVFASIRNDPRVIAILEKVRPPQKT